jgi:Glycosyltransferase family 87
MLHAILRVLRFPERQAPALGYLSVPFRHLLVVITRDNFRSWTPVLGSLLAGALYSWFVGEDTNWDWRNYHEYSAYALLNGRLDVDVAVAGIQTFFNPLAYIPAYLLRHYVPAPFSGMALGAIHGLNLALVYWISRLVLTNAASGWTLAASVIIAAFGPMTLSEVGTSCADILTALPVVAGVGLLLVANRRHKIRFVLAGLCIGAATGLKLTNVVFGVGAVASLLFAARPLMSLSYFAIGGAIGTLATNGVWAWVLWAEFGNPVFPFFNMTFHSPEAPIAANVDRRFLPINFWDAIAYPFYWFLGDHRSSEVPFRDARFAIVFVLGILCAGVDVVGKLRIFTRRDKQFLTFFLTAYGIWLLVFSIHRYAIALELLTAPLIVMLVCRLRRLVVEGYPASAQSFWMKSAPIFAALAIALWSQPADWSRRPWSNPYQPVLPRALFEPATYLMLEKPVGYVVPLLPSGSRFYQLSDILLPIVPGGSLDRRIRNGLANPLPGGVWALHLRGSPARQHLLDGYDMQLDAARSCQIIPGADGVDIEVCPLVATPPAVWKPIIRRSPPIAPVP